MTKIPLIKIGGILVILDIFYPQGIVKLSLASSIETKFKGHLAYLWYWLGQIIASFHPQAFVNFVSYVIIIQSLEG